MPTPSLSVIVVTRDEASNIEACLASTRGLASEWIVVDHASRDDTRERARRFGAAVIETSDWPGFGAQKQRALDAATGDWVLSLDADERVSPALADAVRRATGDAGAALDGYELSRLSRFAGRWIRHGDWHPDRVLRLFRRGRGRFSEDRVHERVLVRGGVGRLEGMLLHETMPTHRRALAKLDRYSSDGAAARFERGERGGVGRGLLHAAWAFGRGYVLKRGFLDGAAGFAVAVYVAEGVWWRYMKIAELARRLPIDADS